MHTIPVPSSKMEIQWKSDTQHYRPPHNGLGAKDQQRTKQSTNLGVIQQSRKGEEYESADDQRNINGGQSQEQTIDVVPHTPLVQNDEDTHVAQDTHESQGRDHEPVDRELDGEGLWDEGRAHLGKGRSSWDERAICWDLPDACLGEE